MVAAIQIIGLGVQYVGDVMLCLGLLVFLLLVSLDGGLK